MKSNTNLLFTLLSFGLTSSIILGWPSSHPLQGSEARAQTPLLSSREVSLATSINSSSAGKEKSCSEQGDNEPNPPPQHQEKFSLDSGVHQGSGSTATKAYETDIIVEAVPWMVITFSEINLGKNSWITITSSRDGGDQIFHQNDLAAWNNTSAVFNGDAVHLELMVDPGDRDIGLKITDVTVGEPGSEPSISSLCGADNRIGSTDPAIGRTSNFCTAWLTSTGAVLTAGHCMGATRIDFKVPESDCDGSANFSDPDDQYPLTLVNGFDDGNGAIGNDWAVYQVGTNSNTGKLPYHVQNFFYRLQKDYDPPLFDLVDITGYGSDVTPAGCTGGANSDNSTLQTNGGPYLGETVQSANDVTLEYQVDTEGGNSGSPIIEYGPGGYAIGIHTNAGCDATSGNYGTGFENNDVENELQDFHGSSTVYLDEKHIGTPTNGNVFTPYSTLTSALAGVADNGTISMASGGYAGAYTIGATGKGVTLLAPVEPVTIGAP